MTHFFSNEMSLVLAVLEVSLHTSFLLPVPNVHHSKEMPEICPIKEMMKIIKVKKKSSKHSSKVIKTDKNDRTDKSRIIEKFLHKLESLSNNNLLIYENP
jgi:hypothetical protein